VPTVVILPRAEAQIIDVLSYTLEEFGEAKYFDYRDLIMPDGQQWRCRPRAPGQDFATRADPR
jgi:hypothetical protein